MRHLLKTALLTTSCTISMMACGEQTDDSGSDSVTAGSSNPTAAVPGPSGSPTPASPGSTTVGSAGGSTAPMPSAQPNPTSAPSSPAAQPSAQTPGAGGTPSVETPSEDNAGGAGVPVEPGPATGAAGAEASAGGAGSEDLEAPDSAGGAGGMSMDMDGMLGMGGAGETPAGEFTLTSTAFSDGDELPDEFTCEGKQFSTGPIPDLSWTAGPEGTLSYAITFIDLTLSPDQNAYHWAMWDIPPDVTSLPGGEISGAEPAEPAGSKQYTPLNPVGFLGPCPGLVGPNTDEYAFVVYALSVESIPNPPNNVKELEQLFLESALATTEMRCFSDAAP